MVYVDAHFCRATVVLRDRTKTTEKLVNSRFDDRDAALRINEILAAAMGQLLNVADM